jgi:hypothetical protein
MPYNPELTGERMNKVNEASPVERVVMLPCCDCGQLPAVDTTGVFKDLVKVSEAKRIIHVCSVTGKTVGVDWAIVDPFENSVLAWNRQVERKQMRELPRTF